MQVHDFKSDKTLNYGFIKKEFWYTQQVMISQIYKQQLINDSNTASLA